MTDELIKGLQAFRHYHYEGDDSALMESLVTQGQDPRYFIISCIDSRCDPATIFRARPGIFFAHKAMGAIVRPYQQGTALAAALQFALHYNNVQKIIVLGHTQCGAVKALAEGLDDPEISSFINVAKNGLEKAQNCCSSHDEVLARTEQEVVLESTENLKHYPSVRDALAADKVEIKSWIFDIKSGDLLEHNAASDQFEIITDSLTTEEDSRKEHA